MVIGREQILSAHDAVIERIDVPEWASNGADKALCIRRFAAQYAFALTQYRGTPEVPSPDFYAAVCGFGICDEQGNQLFKMPDDLEIINRKDSRVVRRVAAAILKLNSLTEETQEEAEKNSESTRNDASLSA